MGCSCKYLWSSVGRKIVMAITGLGLALFIVIHLIGNLLLLGGAEPFNAYVVFLHHLAHGAVRYIAEAGLIVFFSAHAWSGITVYRQKRKARAQGYEYVSNAGGASRKSLASRSMIITGPILLIFLIWHIFHFKFGPGAAEGYTYMLHGREVRDLYRLVVEQFNIPYITLIYVAVMVMLGMHLKHGVWSGFQSLGWTNKRYLPLVEKVGKSAAFVLAFGFIYIPIHIMLFVDPHGVEAAQQVLSGGAH